MMKPRVFSKKKTVIACSILLFVLLAGLFFLPVSVERRLRGVCLVECRSHYAVVVAPGDTLYFRGLTADSLLHGMAAYSDSAVVSSWRTGFFCSNDGLLLTAASLHAGRPARLSEGTLRPLLQKERERLLHLQKVYAGQGEELDYYAKTHTVTDEGYNEVMAFRSRFAVHRGRLDSLLTLFDRALKVKRLSAVRQDSYRVIFREAGDSGRVYEQRFPAEPVSEPDTAVLLLRLQTRALPAGATRFSPCLLSPSVWTPRALPRQLFGYLYYDVPASGSEVLLPDALRLQPGAPSMPVAEGAPVVNVFGQLAGVRVAGGVVPASAVSRAVYGWRSYPLALWHNFVAFWRSRFGSPAGAVDTLSAGVPSLPLNVSGRFMAGRSYGSRRTDSTAYIGRLTGGRPDGIGEMHYADGAVYRGRWSGGVRCGFGVLTDTLGRRFWGVWRADSLPAGFCSDSLGLYRGCFDAGLDYSGRGTYRSERGTYYCGEWLSGQRHGFGFSVEPAAIVRCGIWRKGRFRGEQMIYTADRIYGIDISRYQHERGRQRFPIDWSRLRITHLGATAERSARGDTDYPVSFIFIKATQGTSIRSRYYAQDAAHARRRGIAVGAYHFFTTRPGRSQADFFLRTAAPRRGDLPPVLDVELTRRQIASMGGVQAMFREMLAWLRRVETRTGTRPVLYVSQQFVNLYMPDAPAALRDYDVWIARYGEYRPYVRLLFWQLTARGRVSGIRTEVDINVFNGSKEQFREYLRTACVK